MFKIGDRVGCLEIIELGLSLYKGGQNNNAAKVKCKCGLESVKQITKLKKEKYTFCHRQCPLRRKTIDLSINEKDFLVKINQEIGCWIVIDNPFYRIIQRPTKKRPNRRCKTQVVKCKCICGTERIVECNSLIKGLSNSCGACSHRQNNNYRGGLLLDGKKRCSTCGKNKDKKFYSCRKLTIDGLNHSCRECVRYRNVKYRHLISKNEYDKLYKLQNKSCAICGAKRSNNKVKMLSVDHCHKTGKVRGLLCSKCNTGIGKFNDNIELLNNAIKYLSDFVTL